MKMIKACKKLKLFNITISSISSQGIIKRYSCEAMKSMTMSVLGLNTLHSDRPQPTPSKVNNKVIFRPLSTTMYNDFTISPNKTKKVTTQSLASQSRRGEKITMVTAYDYPSALHVDRAGMDIILVGDSCAMVELGFETTQPMTMQHMIHHCQAVKRGAPDRPLLVADMPLGSYEFEDIDTALNNALRLIKDGGMDAVKLEGGCVNRAKTVKKLVDCGVPVMGHIGLTPQSIGVIGGFRSQGRTASEAKELINDALRLQNAGAFSVVLECIPGNVGAAITRNLNIPTIGIGAGGSTDGQVLVYHDLVGMTTNNKCSGKVPKFCKEYANIGRSIHDGLVKFKHEVSDGTFPGKEFSPYVMIPDQDKLFGRMILNRLEEKKNKFYRSKIGKINHRYI